MLFLGNNQRVKRTVSRLKTLYQTIPTRCEVLAAGTSLQLLQTEVEYESDEDIVSDFFKGIAWIVVLGGVGLILLACVMGALNNL